MKKLFFAVGAAICAAGFAVDLDNVMCYKRTHKGQTSVTFMGVGLKEPVRILFSTDNHIGMADERDEAYRDNYTRMNGGGRENFEKLVACATRDKYDILLLGGDTLSHPAQAGVDFVSNTLAKCEIPWLYVSGNHDWCFEGLPGTRQARRAEWLEKRLKPLFQGRNPLMACVDVKGLRILAIDNSMQEILPEQLVFLREKLRDGLPTVVLSHIPYYMPDVRSYDCGSPHWGAKRDTIWQIERRDRWPEAGHTQVTYDFCRELYGAGNVVAILAGHIHADTIASYKGVHQITDLARKPTGLAVTIE